MSAPKPDSVDIGDTTLPVNGSVIQRVVGQRCRLLSDQDLRAVVEILQRQDIDVVAGALELFDERRRSLDPTRPAPLIAADTLECLPVLLRETRHARGLTVAVTAGEIGVSAGAVTSWELGIRMPALPMAIRILRWIGGERA